MESFTVFHTADWHLRDSDIDECTEMCERIVRKAQDERPELIVHAGDITDRAETPFGSKAADLATRTFRRLSEIAPVVGVKGTPSHEGPNPMILGMAAQAHPIYIANRPEQVFFDRCGGMATISPVRSAYTKAIISLIPQPTKQWLATDLGVADSDERVAYEMANIFVLMRPPMRDTLPHIMAGHYTIRGAEISDTQLMIGRDIEISRDSMLMAAPTLGCFGHIHRYQRMNDIFFYSGSPRPIDYGEKEDKGVCLHVVHADGQNPATLAASEFINLYMPRRVTIRKDMVSEGWTPEQSLIHDKHIDALVNGNHVKVEFKIWSDETGLLSADEARSFILGLGARSCKVDVITVPRENSRALEIIEMRTLDEKIKERAKITGDTITTGILAKAAELESEGAPAVIGRYRDGR